MNTIDILGETLLENSAHTPLCHLPLSSIRASNAISELPTLSSVDTIYPMLSTIGITPGRRLAIRQDHLTNRASDMLNATSTAVIYGVM